MQPGALRQHFESSAFVRDVWPPALRLRTADAFAPQAVFDDLSVWGQFNKLESLRGVLTLSSLHTLPLLLMGTEPAVQRIAVPLYEAGARDAGLELEMGARAMSERDYQAAAHHFALVTEGPRAGQARVLRTLALELLGKPSEARRSRPPVRARPCHREWTQRGARGVLASVLDSARLDPGTDEIDVSRRPSADGFPAWSPTEGP